MRVRFKYSVRDAYGTLSYKYKTIKIVTPVDAHGFIRFGEISKMVERYLLDNKIDHERVLWFQTK